MLKLGVAIIDSEPDVNPTLLPPLDYELSTPTRRWLSLPTMAI